MHADRLRSVWRLWGYRGRVTTTEPQPQDTSTLLSSTPSMPPLAQRSRMELLGFKEPKSLPGSPFLRLFCRQNQPWFTLFLETNTELSDHPSLHRGHPAKVGCGCEIWSGMERLTGADSKVGKGGGRQQTTVGAGAECCKKTSDLSPETSLSPHLLQCGCVTLGKSLALWASVAPWVEGSLCPKHLE